MFWKVGLGFVFGRFWCVRAAFVRTDIIYFIIKALCRVGATRVANPSKSLWGDFDIWIMHGASIDAQIGRRFYAFAFDGLSQFVTPMFFTFIEWYTFTHSIYN